MGSWSKPIQEIVDRLKFHTGLGQLAAGIKFRDIPKKEIDGVEDLPNVTMRLSSAGELNTPGGRQRGHAHGAITITLSVATLREKGWPELTQWIEKITDAVFTNRVLPFHYDPSLTGLANGVPVVNVTTDSTLDLSLNATITIRVQSKEYLPNQRRT